MKTGKMILAFAYLRLSREEMQTGESGSITNQRMIISNYCKQNNIVLVREFVDDGWSGGNFDRPAFQDMMRQLSGGAANTVITKDLSRLGRDMRESSYYAEQFFPENGIRYIAIADNFDTEHDNIMAPFQFAMNEVYLRDGSRKVKDVLKNKRENGRIGQIIFPCAVFNHGIVQFGGNIRCVAHARNAGFFGIYSDRRACRERNSFVYRDFRADCFVGKSFMSCRAACSNQRTRKGKSTAD